MPADEMSSGLTEMEKMALQQLSRKHPHQRLRTRGLGLFELASGRRVHEIAVGLEVSDKSMYMGAFLERQGDDRPWFLGHRMVLFYLPPCSPELNLIKMALVQI